MIFLKPRGGLCNRMRAIDAMITLCESANRDLTILWYNFPELNCSFDQLFKPIESPKIKVRVISQKWLLRYYWFRFRKNLLTDAYFHPIYVSSKPLESGLSLLATDELFADKVNGEVIEIIKNRRNFIFETCFRLAPIGERPFERLKPTDEIASLLEYSNIPFDGTIGVHVRGTDHPSKGRNTSDNVIRLLNDHLEHHPEDSFFISTDESQVKEDLIATFGGKAFFNKVPSQDRNIPEAIKYALVDLLCLSRTKRIYGSFVSSFSYTAALIGEVDIEIIPENFKAVNSEP